ncbi:hypothetical protein [Curtobacterium flaccumfaciens]|uniref:hypothetical protein n=1 Tax=Curtobacterium flaccumfaciens TaxID=2035 RepID=UPI00220DEDA4|nr:hypothetical protein [Curtobacterium flaccumfaciens]UWD80180.1 hypothetical protein NY058_05190 [Curtobacterium flaccumfaciens]
MTAATTTDGAVTGLPADRLATLRERFAPLFATIRDGAVERELASGTPGDRPLPHAEVRALAEGSGGSACRRTAAASA